MEIHENSICVFVSNSILRNGLQNLSGLLLKLDSFYSSCSLQEGKVNLFMKMKTESTDFVLLDKNKKMGH